MPLHLKFMNPQGRYGVRTLPVLFVLVAAVIGLSCSDDEDSTPSTTASLEAAAAEPIALGEFTLRMGERVTLTPDEWAPGLAGSEEEQPAGSGVSLTFVEIEWLDSLNDETFGTGPVSPLGRWLLVRYLLTNHLPEAVTPSTALNSRMALYDDADRRWKGNPTHEANAALMRGDVPATTAVLPGETVTTVLLFDAPANATGLQLFSEALDFAVDLGLDDEPLLSE